MQIASPTMMQRDEAERLKSLAQYEILDTLPDPALDEITRLAASFCRAPYAFISFIDASRVWFKSRIGFLSRQHCVKAPGASHCHYWCRANGKPGKIRYLRDSPFREGGFRETRFHNGSSTRFPRQKTLHHSPQTDEEETTVDIRAFSSPRLGTASIKPALAARIVAQVVLPVGTS